MPIYLCIFDGSKLAQALIYLEIFMQLHLLYSNYTFLSQKYSNMDLLRLHFSLRYRNASENQKEWFQLIQT